MELLSIEEAAQRLGVSIATARRWAASGKIRASKSGKQWIVDGSSLVSRGQRRHQSGIEPVNLAAALRHVRRTDLAEAPVPDILRHRDELENDDAVLTTARGRLEGTTPSPAIEIDVDKTAIFTRRMTSLRLEDRVAYQAAVSSFADRVEARTPDAVFSARLSSDKRYFLKRGSDQWSKWRMDAFKKLVPGREWLAATDLTAYFDTISHRTLFVEIESLNVDSSVVIALREMLREWGISDGLGLPQGPNASRLLGNLFLLPVDEAMLNAGWNYSRYLDDVRIITESRVDAVKAVRQFQQECQRRGLIVSSSKTQLLHGEKAKESLIGSTELAAVDYWFHAHVPGIAQQELKKLLRQALRSETNIDTRKARFSLWRLAQLRDSGVIGQVLKRLEDLAPLASVVAAYLQPFISRKKIVKGLGYFLADPLRAYSDYLSTWLFAVMLEHPGPMPREWVDQARTRVKNRNQPNYLRAITAVIVARGERAGDISWMKQEISREHDPIVLRGFTVGLHWAGQLDKAAQKKIVARAPHLNQTINYLRGRSRLPSLVYTDRWIEIGQSRA
jgi:excisionase family DNA binding protein